MLEEARKLEPMAQQGVALAQRLNNVDPSYTGDILKLPGAYLVERVRRQFEGKHRWKHHLPSPTPEQQTSSTPAEESQDTGERRSSLFSGKLNNKIANYQIQWRSERGNVKLPCCLCGTLAKNRKWLLAQPTSIESATLQRPDGEGDDKCNLPCCFGLRFEVRFGPAPLLVDKQLTWPFFNKSRQPIKSCPDEPSLDLLVGCFLCVQKLPSSRGCSRCSRCSSSRCSRCNRCSSRGCSSGSAAGGGAAGGAAAGCSRCSSRVRQRQVQ